VLLEDVCDVTDGTHYTPPNTGGPFPFLTVKDMTEHALAFKTCSYVTEAEFAKARSMGACPTSGDVLFSKDGTVGKVYVVSNERPFAVLSSIAILRPDRAQLDPTYLGYALRSPVVLRDATNRKTGSALQRIILGDLKEVSIPLPDLSKQKRIAAMLEQADRLRRTRHYALKLSETFLPTGFLELFGSLSFQRVPLGDLALPVRGSFVNGPFGSNLLTTELVHEGVPVIYIRDIADGRYQRVSTVCVTPTKAQELSICNVIPGDLLIAKVGDPPGKAAIYPKGYPSGVVTQDVIRLRLNLDLALPEYLRSFLNSSSGYQLLSPIIVEGTRERFGLTPYKELAVPVPPLKTQERFTSLVARHERLQARQREALRQADHLFQSLLHRTFS
jgi:type I restriction enzyme, S subunit